MSQDLEIKPWERQPWESPTSYALFRHYLEQVPPRSLREAYSRYRVEKGRTEARPGTQVPGSYRNLSNGKKGNGAEIEGSLTFEERARAWDDEQDAEDRRKWAERRRELREKEWGIATDLFQKAQQMLMFPVAETLLEDGQTLIVPANWSMREIPTIAQTASRLSRLAAEMNTAKIEVDWRDEARNAGIQDPEKIFQELVREFEDRLAGEDGEGGMGDGETELPGSEPGEISEIPPEIPE